MQTQTVRGYPGPVQRRVLGRRRMCRTKGWPGKPVPTFADRYGMTGRSRRTVLSS